MNLRFEKIIRVDAEFGQESHELPFGKYRISAVTTHHVHPVDAFRILAKDFYLRSFAALDRQVTETFEPLQKLVIAQLLHVS